MAIVTNGVEGGKEFIRSGALANTGGLGGSSVGDARESWCIRAASRCMAHEKAAALDTIFVYQ